MEYMKIQKWHDSSRTPTLDRGVHSRHGDQFLLSIHDYNVKRALSISKHFKSYILQGQAQDKIRRRSIVISNSPEPTKNKRHNASLSRRTHAHSPGWHSSARGQRRQNAHPARRPAPPRSTHLRRDNARAPLRVAFLASVSQGARCLYPY